MNIRFKQILIGIGIVSLMTFFLIKTNNIDPAAHNRFSQQLRQLKEIDETLDKDILELRYGLVSTHDQLMNDQGEIKRLRAALTSEPGFLNRSESERLGGLQDDFGSLQDKKNVLIEEFKSQNAILNNSVRYFPVAASKVNSTNTSSRGHGERAPQLNELLRDILTFYLLPNTDLEQSIQSRIERLEKIPVRTPFVLEEGDLNKTLTHARTIVKLKPEVDNLLTRIVSAPTSEKVEEMIDAYDSYYDDSVSQANIYRLLLYTFSVLLLVYIALIIVRLRKATLTVTATNETVKATNENLEQRVQDRTMELMWSNIELQKSETNNKALLHAMPDAIWRTDGDGLFLDVIPAQAENPLVSARQWKGNTIHDFLPPHISNRMMELAGLSLGSGEPQILDFVLSNNDKIQHYECRIVVCGESEILTVVRDVTELKQAVAESQVILETMQGISTTSNLKELLDHIYQSISRFLYAENCFVALYDAKTETLDMEFFVDTCDDVQPAGKLGRGLSGYAFRIAEPMLLTGGSIQQLVEDGEVELLGTPPAVWMGVPLRTPKGVIGVLVVQHYTDRSVYGQRDLELLTSIGDQIAVAIERKRAEEAVQNSRDYLDQIINAVGDPIFVKNRKHQLMLVNDAMSTLTGRSRDELIGRADYDFLPADEADVFWEKDELVFTSGNENVNEEQITDGNGNKRVIVTRKRLHTDKEGEKYIVGVINDISERKKAEEVLRENIKSKEESLALLDTIIATAPIGVAFHNCDLIYERINENLAAINGLSVEEHLGRTLREVLPEMANRLEPLLHQVLDTGEPIIDFAVSGETGSNKGDPHHWSLNVYPVCTKAGEMLGVGVLVQDVTEARTAEESLRKSESKFRDLFDNAPVAYHELDVNGCFTRVNRTEESLLGYTEAELKGRHPSEIIVEQLSREATAAKLAGTMPLQAVERTFIRKDGSLVAVLNEDRLILDSDGAVIGIRSTLQDISERKLLEDKVQRGQKLESIGQLAAGIAHEINTPTQYVGDNVRFLEDSFLDYGSVLEKSFELLEVCRSRDILPEYVPAMAETIRLADFEYLNKEVPKAFKQALDGVERIRKIVQSMKDFAHPGSNDFKATDINKAIESTLTVASNEWKYVADVVTDYDEGLPLIPCLTGELNQVVLNLIVNAAHAIAEATGDGSNGKGTISISTKLNAEMAEIRISDTGTGMSDEVRKKIFDPFFTTKEVGKGTGQGLAISHTVIVEKHGGTIDVESEVGVGTTFVVCLPINNVIV